MRSPRLAEAHRGRRARRRRARAELAVTATSLGEYGAPHLLWGTGSISIVGRPSARWGKNPVHIFFLALESVGIRAVRRRLMCPAPVARSFSAGCCDIKERKCGLDTRGHTRRRRATALPVARARGATLLTRPDLPVTGEDTVLLAPLSDGKSTTPVTARPVHLYYCEQSCETCVADDYLILGEVIIGDTARLAHRRIHLYHGRRAHKWAGRRTSFTSHGAFNHVGRRAFTVAILDDHHGCQTSSTALLLCSCVSCSRWSSDCLSRGELRHIFWFGVLL